MIVGTMLLVRHAFDVLLNPAFDDPEVNLFELTDVSHIWWLAVGLLGFTGFAAWLRYFEQVDAERLGQQYSHRVRMQLFDRMGKFSPRTLSQRTSGATMLRFVGDLTSVRRWVSRGLAKIVVSGLVTVIALGFLAYLDAYLAITSIALLSLGLAWNLSLGPKMHQAVAEARKRRGRLAGNINEKILSFVVIQAFNQQARERIRFNRHSRRLRNAMVDRARASGRMRAVTDGATAASMGFVLSLGALLVFKGMTTSGNVVAAMSVVGFLSTAFRDLGRVHEFYRSAEVSRQKIINFLQTPIMYHRSRRPGLVVGAGTITLDNVSLAGCLQEISGTIEGGEVLALLGHNGAGKSTLLQVVARLVDPDSGRVLIDGQDIARCNLASVRRAIGMVTPDLPLMRGTLDYNLRYRWPEAPEDEVARVRELCQLQDLIKLFDKGEQHLVQEGGRNLSLGQRHRLAVARAILGNPPILIVDEIDANLDTHAAKVLDRVLDDYRGTVLMVSRSSERLARADLLWRMVNGRLVQVEPRLPKSIECLKSTEEA